MYVRGLGDRYTKSILNGVDIPGLDPDRNTIQMDVFPTNILENVIVIKSAAAEYPADFTGGVIDIVTILLTIFSRLGTSFIQACGCVVARFPSWGVLDPLIKR